MSGKVISTNISTAKGTVKESVAKIVVDNYGVNNDAHAGNWHRQISLLSIENIKQFADSTKIKIKPGDFAENITTEGIDLQKVHLLDQFSINDVILEVTQLGKTCHGENCAIFQAVGQCIMPTKGIFCRVLNGGEIHPGNVITHHQRTLKIQVITLSDRAFRGEYPDLSGKAAIEILQEFAVNHRWQLQLSSQLLPDEQADLEQLLTAGIKNNTDIIFTLGGTGIGPRDITIEAITAISSKTIPGIMEAIRIKYGLKKPNALLSRSIAVVKNQTQIYALPGSVKAVSEYLAEITKIIDHVTFMIKGLDAH